MYSRSPGGVNVMAATVAAALAAGVLVNAQSNRDRPDASCAPAYAGLFAPLQPRLGRPPAVLPWTSRYEVCTSSEPLTALAQADWTIEATAPLDAFGAAGTYDRAKVARLYGGRWPRVARGWRRSEGQLESITLVSPYPNATLTRLEPGTLIIRHILCCT